MWLRANSMSVLGDRLWCWLKRKRKAVSFLCVQTRNRSVQGAVLMRSVQNDIGDNFPRSSWFSILFTRLPQLPFTCGDQIVTFQFPPLWIWFDCPQWVWLWKWHSKSLPVGIKSWIRSAKKDNRIANVVMMVGERTCCLPNVVCFFSKWASLPRYCD